MGLWVGTIATPALCTARLILRIVILSVLVAARTAAGVQLAERLIANEPEAVLEPRTTQDLVEVVRWPLRSVADLAGWTVLDATAAPGPDGLVFRGTGPSPRLEREVNLDAAGVDAFRIDSTQQGRWSARILWRREGEHFAGTRSAGTARFPEGRRGAAPREFVVGADPAWSGRITHMRFVLSRATDAAVVVDAIVGLRYRPNPERSEAATRQPWKVEMQGAEALDMRSAELAPRARPIVRAISGRPNARLRFDYGVLGRLSGRLCFQVYAESAAGPTVDLAERCLEPSESDRWFSADVDLAPLGGQSGRLLFALGGDPGTALPVWGNPEIITPAVDERPNVVLVSIDTLRADRLTPYGYKRPTSPHLDRWARERAVTFLQAVANAPWTLPSHTSMLSGVSALRHGVNYIYAAPADLLTVAEILRPRGYATLAVTGGAYLSPWSGLHQGFDRYASWRDRRREREGAELATHVDLARQWLREVSDRPFFLFFHTYEVHAPYVAREPFFSRFNQSGLELPKAGIDLSGAGMARESGFVSVHTPIWGRPSRGRPLGDGALPPTALPLLDALYDSGIAYMDQELSRLFATLTELGLDRRTMVIVTSDHGEALGERGLAGHAYLYDMNLRVPLLVALPNGRHAGQRIGAQVESIDIVPTVLEELGLPPPAAADGRSLLPLLSGQPAGERRAWSYAAQSNHGIALRLDANLKYVFNNNAWAPAQGQETLLRIDRESGAEREDADATSQRSALRRELLHRYATDGPSALELIVVNRLAGELNGHIRMPGLKAMQVKAVEPPPGKLRWRNQAFDFSVPPGRRLQLFLEGNLAESLTLSLRSRKEIDVGEQTSLSTVTLPRALEVATGQAARWSDGALPAGATGVELAWRGPGRKATTPDAVSLPAEVREQLRALGYEQ